MAKLTLLNMTQSILSNMDSDEVNSISDTIEATQVANIIRDEYREIADEHDIGEDGALFQLTASGTTSRPTHMTLPTNVVRVDFIKYDAREAVGDTPAFKQPEFLFPDEFVTLVNARGNSDSNIEQITDDTSSIVFHIQNDKAPDYWTTFDDSVLIFDSFDNSVDSTLQAAKTICYGRERTDISLTDAAVVNLPEHLFSFLRTQAEEKCFDLFKDGAPRTVAQKAHRQRVRAQRTKNRIVTDPIDKLPNYGRR